MRLALFLVLFCVHCQTRSLPLRVERSHSDRTFLQNWWKSLLLDRNNPSPAPKHSFNECAERPRTSRFLTSLLSRLSSSRPNSVVLYWKSQYDGSTQQVEHLENWMEAALRLWSQSSPLLFRHSNDQHLPDLTLGFKIGTPKVELDISNDTHPHLILHYKSIINGLGEQFSIVNAIAHALGHLFGLEHSKDSHSVMFAGHPRMNSMSLGADVEKRVQNLMGFCQEKFKFLAEIYFDEKMTLFFFGQKTLWLYENRSSQGGEFPVAWLLPEMPQDLDNVLYFITYPSNDSFLTQAYGFKGNTVQSLYGVDLHLVSSRSFNSFKCPLQLNKVQTSFFLHFIYLYNQTHFFEFDSDDFYKGLCPRRIFLFNELFKTNPSIDLHASKHIYVPSDQHFIYFFLHDEVYEGRLPDKHENSYSLTVTNKGKWYHTFPGLCSSDPLIV